MHGNEVGRCCLVMAVKTSFDALLFFWCRNESEIGKKAVDMLMGNELFRDSLKDQRRGI